MTRLVRMAIALTVASASCVPASEPLPPAGAGGFDVVPSPGARGEPFESDGWMLRVDKLVVRTDVAVQPDGASNAYFANDGARLVDASKSTRFYVPALPTGHGRMDARLSGQYISVLSSSPSASGSSSSTLDDLNVNDVAPADVERFAQASDEGVEDSGYGMSFGRGPSVIIVVRARRDGREISLELALASETPPGGGVPTDIRENDLTLAMLDVVPEAVFTDDLAFGKLAALDVDADGRLTAAELRAATVPTPTPSPLVGPGVTGTYLAALSTRFGFTLLRARPR